MDFKKATKQGTYLRLAIVAPAGGGKTMTALKIARGLVGAHGRIAVIDSERGSASKYANLCEFDTLQLDTFSPDTYVKAIQTAERAGYDVCIVDSLSHAWTGTDGALAQVDKHKAQNRGENSFTAWRHVTPMHKQLVDTMLGCRMHLIVTMRAKTEYVMEEYTDKNGKTRQKPVKVGLAPVQRDGMEYEFDVVADMDIDHNMLVSKTRIPALDNAWFTKPGEDLAQIIKDWYADAEPEPARPATPAAPPRPAAPPQPPQDPDKAARQEQYQRWLRLKAEFDLDKQYMADCMSNWEIAEFATARPAVLAEMLDAMEETLRAAANDPAQQYEQRTAQQAPAEAFNDQDY